jgi:hypothetical protein
LPASARSSPVPAFYIKPKSVDALVDHTIGRVLDLLDLDTAPSPSPTPGAKRRIEGAPDRQGSRLPRSVGAVQQLFGLATWKSQGSDLALGTNEINHLDLKLGQAPVGPVAVSQSSYSAQ